MINTVGPGFFDTLSITRLAGRDLVEADAGSPLPVAIVNESFLNKFNLGTPNDALGKRIGFGASAELDIEIVGVVGDSVYSNVKESIPPQVFLPRVPPFDNPDSLYFYLHAGIEPDAVMRMVAFVVSSIDLPVDNLTTMRQQVRDNVYVDRLIAMLSAGFAALATLLAAIELYGVLAYNVTQRTRELNLRLALGAEPRRLRAMVLKQVVVMSLIGGAAGLAAGVGLGRAVIRSRSVEGELCSQLARHDARSPGSLSR